MGSAKEAKARAAVVATTVQEVLRACAGGASALREETPFSPTK
jgi:hypothetical protein